METNEIEKKTITVIDAENAQENKDTQPSALNTEEIKEQEIEIIENEKENSSIVEIPVKQPVVVDIQETQRIEILSELLKDTEKTQIENTYAKNKGDSLKQINDAEPDVKKIGESSGENKVIELKDNQNDKSNEEKINEKQHNQDKKDYRLEKLLLDRINEMQGKIKESLELIKKFERINAKEENLPNIVTTLRDKLTQEVIKQFRTVGIEFNMKSYLVQSVVSDLLSKFEEGITEFKECSENLNFVKEVQDDFEAKMGLAPTTTSKFKNMFARLRGVFKPEKKQERLIDLERARQEKKLEEANIHLIKYKYKNSELEKYTIRKNIVDSLTREMIYGKDLESDVPVEQFIAKNITPQMEQLGLQYLNEALEESLYKEYKEKCSIQSKEEFMKKTTGEIKRNVKLHNVETVRSKISAVAAAKNIEQEDEMAI